MLTNRPQRLFAPDDGTAPGPAADPVPAAPAAADDDFEIPDELQPEPAAAEPETEYEDLELDGGIKIKYPKGKHGDVERHLLREADYTKKTMAAAAATKEAEAARTRYEAAQQTDGEISEGVFHLKNIDADLNKRYAYFQSPEYRTLQDEDPLKARSLYDNFQMDRDRRETLASLVRQKHQERTVKLEAEAKVQTEAEATRRAALPREIAKKIPGFNAEKLAKVKEFGATLGYAPEALNSTTDPLHFETLYYAEWGKRYLDALQRKGSGAVTPRTAEPTKMVGRSGAQPSTAPKDSDDMDTWMRKEQEREQAKRKARA